MAFLTKKEQTVITLVKSSKTIDQAKKQKLAETITENARLRQDGYKMPVREFIQAMANYNSDRILEQVK